MIRRHSFTGQCAFAGTITVALLAAAGVAASDSPLAQGVSKNQPVMLTAQEVGYDEKHAIATAIGHVEVVQGTTILLADRIEYNQNTDVVHAVGHVSILQPTGDVVFSSDAWLTHQMEKGVVQQFRARLKDNSLFAAREAYKTSKNVTILKQAVYSPCHVCAPAPGNSPSAPLWQVEASKVTVDENAQRVMYNNAFMEVYGVPIGYSPYFSHPTPDAPSQSGLLTPEYFHATDLGNVVKEPVFISLAPNMDMTLTPWYLSQEKPLMEAEFRHLLDNGFYTIRGAYTKTYDHDAAGNITSGTASRSFGEAHGRLDLSDHWDAGIDAERTSDDTFLQLYRFGWKDMLTSRIYAERVEDRDYASIESLAFQGLEQQDIAAQSPYILPQVGVHYETQPLIAHSRLTFDGNGLVLTRQEGDTDQRLSSTVGWTLPYTTKGGQVITANATLRGDAYNINDQIVNTGPTPEPYNGQVGRVLPQMEMDWRYPLLSRFGDSGSVVLSPVAMAAVSPNINQNLRIPDEDSQIAELNDTNLFSPDRYTGLDQVESGFRGAYGMRGQVQVASDKYIDWLAGQAYQNNVQSAFPLTSDINAHFSDYIAHLSLKYKWVDVAYSVRFDRDSFAPISNEVTTNLVVHPVSLSLTFVSLRNEPLFGDRKEVFGNTSLELTPNWTWNFAGRRDLGSSEQTPINPALPVSYVNPLEASTGTVGLNTSIVFHNECLSLATTVGRNYISQQDVKPSTTVGVILVLKNFGSPAASTTAQQPTGAGNITTAGGSVAGQPIDPSSQSPSSSTPSSQTRSGSNP